MKIMKHVLLIVSLLFHTVLSQPLSLEETYELALKHHPTLQIMKKKIEIAKGSMRVTLANFLPEVTVDGTFARQRTKNYGTTLIQTQFEGTNVTGFTPAVDRERWNFRGKVE